MPDLATTLDTIATMSRDLAAEVSAAQDLARALPETPVTITPAPGDLRPVLAVASQYARPVVITLAAGGSYSVGQDYIVPSHLNPIVIATPDDQPAATITGEWKHPVVDAGNYHFGNVRLVGLPNRTDRTLIAHGTDTATDPLQQPSGITYTRVRVDGTATGYKRGILAHSRNGRFISGAIVNCLHTSADAQAICSYNGGQDWLVTDSLLEGATENVLLGGGMARNAEMVSRRWRFERCVFHKPVAWRSPFAQRCKNIFEIKAGIDIAIVDCSLIGSWSTLQNGAAFVFKACNSGETGDWVRTEQILVRGCTVQDVGVGIVFVGRNEAGPTQVMDGVTVERTAFLGITKNNGGSGRAMHVADGPKNVTLRDVWFDNVEDFVKVWTVPIVCEGWRFERVTGRTGTYAFNGDSVGKGLVTVQSYFPDVVMDSVSLRVNSTNVAAWMAIPGVSYVADDATFLSALKAGWQTATALEAA